jgi:hypothetical protein
MTSLFPIILVNIANVLGAIGALFFKMASDTIKLNNFFRSRKLMLGVLMYFASAVIYISFKEWRLDYSLSYGGYCLYLGELIVSICTKGKDECV